MSTKLSLQQAVKIVLQLAEENVLEERDCDNEKELLDARKEQLEAIDKLSAFFEQNLD